MDTQDVFASGYSEAVAAKRLANDTIAKGADRLSGDETLIEFFCECADLACRGLVRLTVEEFRLCRSGAVIAPAGSHD